MHDIANINNDLNFLNRYTLFNDILKEKLHSFYQYTHHITYTSYYIYRKNNTYLKYIYKK